MFICLIKLNLRRSTLRVLQELCFVCFSAPPGPPQDLKTSRVGPDYVTLEWKPPAKDGGAKVTGYRVEKCEETSEEWVKVEDIKSFDTVYKVTSLKDGVGYYFSVSAKNQAGYGEPCETDKPIKPKKPEGKHDFSSFLGGGGRGKEEGVFNVFDIMSYCVNG